MTVEGQYAEIWSELGVTIVSGVCSNGFRVYAASNQRLVKDTCLLDTQDETLWVIVPEVELLDTILAVYPNFTQKK